MFFPFPAPSPYQKPYKETHNLTHQLTFTVSNNHLQPQPSRITHKHSPQLMKTFKMKNNSSTQLKP